MLLPPADRVAIPVRPHAACVCSPVSVLSKLHRFDDDLHHFFQDCWHLKEWIKNDRSLHLPANIEDAVASHKALRIVADLANGSKHFVRTTHREGAYVTSTSVTAHLGQDRGVDVVHVVSLNDGTTVTARDVATEAYEAWDTVLRTLGLISTDR